MKSAGETSFELVPIDGERHWHAWPGPRAVRRDDSGPTGAGGVDEHLAASVGLEERRRGRLRVEALGAPRDRPRRGRRVLHRHLRVDRHEDVHALGSARLHCAGEARLRRALGARGERRRPPSRTPVAVGGSRSRTRWVARSRRSARANVGWYSIARWLANHSSVRRSLHNAYETVRFDASAHSGTVATHSGVYFGNVLLHERGLAPSHPDDRQRPVAQLGKDPVAHVVEVVDQIALRRSGTVEQRLVEVGQIDPVPRLVAA